MSTINQLQHALIDWIALYSQNIGNNTRFIANTSDSTTSSDSLHGMSIQAPRLILCLSHYRIYNILAKDGPEEIRLKPGQVLFFSPQAWLNPLEQSQFDSIGIKLHQNQSEVLWRSSSIDQQSVWATPSLIELLNPLHQQALDLLATCRQNTDSSWHKLAIGNKIIDIIIRIGQNLESGRLPSPSKAQRSWMLICEYIQDNFSQDINRNTVARALHLHPNHISRLFKTYSRHSFINHLQELRMNHARDLLGNHTMNIQKISEHCGMENATYFSQLFKQYFHCTPSQYRLENSIR